MGLIKKKKLYDHFRVNCNVFYFWNGGMGVGDKEWLLGVDKVPNGHR